MSDNTMEVTKSVEEIDEGNSVKIVYSYYENKSRTKESLFVSIYRKKKNRWEDAGGAWLDINALRFMIK